MHWLGEVVEMRHAKAVLGIALAVMLILATLPQAWAVVEDPFYKVLEQYGYNPEKHHETFKEAYDKAVKALLSKPENELTKEEAVWLGDYFINQAGPVGARDPEILDKAIHYYNLALEKDPDYALAYGGLAAVYDEKGEYQKALIYADKFIMLNPDGTVKHYGESDVEALNKPDGGVGWIVLANLVSGMEAQGYKVHKGLAKDLEDIKTQGYYKELKTVDDLKKIGYIEYREKYLVPLMEQRAPLSVRVAHMVSSDRAVQRLVQEYFAFFAFLAAVLALVALWGTVKIGQKIARH